ncbi:replicative DNA helicase [Metabacillus litoralis]|uniref:replicative DNA helicase n=1 Tax=Metabacillus litoralis TaxID=152268 RepID=UPI0020407263|nr:DnaB-like helicase C-terminal domain-containing protein [Metabacillus litoralis]MCM3411484.1 AAA family ATPase [Metabacillus litoralis]
MNSIGEHNGFDELSAEQSVLGAVLLDPNVLDDISFLEYRDFASMRHQQIYKVMKYLSRKSLPVDIVTITEAYVKFGKVEEMGGVNYLSQLADSCPTAKNAAFYARLVRSKAIGRRGANLGAIISDMSREEFESDEEYFANIEALVSEMRPQETSKMQSFAETKDSYFQHLAKKAEFVRTGFYQYDSWAHGLWRGWLFVSAGRPSVGKTAMLLQRLYGVAKNDNAGCVLLWSQEMDTNQIKDRMISQATGISYGKIKNKKLTDKEKESVEIAYEMFELLPIFIQDSAGVTIDEVRSTARLFKKKYGKIDCIAVDYLQIMSIPQKNGETRSQAIGRVTAAAKQIAREMNCPFIMLSQMTRDSENFKKPMLSHLKESGSIEQDADMVEFLWHDPNDTDSGGKVIQQTFAKGRDTGVNEFRLLFRGWKQHFEELRRA